MGREVRMVVPNWEHPKEETYNHMTRQYKKTFIVMYDGAFEPAMEEWVMEYNNWKLGIGGYGDREFSLEEFLDWIGSPPDPKYYRPNWKKENMTWFQIYETVSEGTPISPPFETKEELIEWMSNNLDYWGKQWTREQAEHFVNGSGFALSGICVNGQCKNGYEVVPKG